MLTKFLLMCVALVLHVTGFAAAAEEGGESASENDVPTAGEGAAESAAVTVLTLEDCVELAIKQNRRFLREEENLILEHISYELTRHNYGPLVRAAITSELDDDGSTLHEAEFSVTQRLLTGGDLRLSASSTGSRDGDLDVEAYSSALVLSYIQPLLKDAGRRVEREELTTAERELEYARRSLILFREEFLIGIVRQYYRILQQERAVGNQEKKVGNAKSLFVRSKAQLGRGKASPIDVYRAELTLLRAQNQLIDARDLHDISLDEFNIDLGLPAETEISLEKRELEFKAIEVDFREYVRLALANRLDLKTVTEEAEDSKRRLDIARNRLRSRLDLSMSVQSLASPADRFRDQEFDDPEWSVQLEYELPLDRKAERTDYRQQLIDYLRSVRSKERLRDEIIVGVRTVIRDLRKAEATLKIQKQNIDVAEKQLKRSRSDYDRGTINTLDVVDALDDLTDARNRYDGAIVDYTIAKLELLRLAGILEFENWKELIR